MIAVEVQHSVVASRVGQGGASDGYGLLHRPPLLHPVPSPSILSGGWNGACAHCKYTGSICLHALKHWQACDGTHSRALPYPPPPSHPLSGAAVPGHLPHMMFFSCAINRILRRRGAAARTSVRCSVA